MSGVASPTSAGAPALVVYCEEGMEDDDLSVEVTVTSKEDETEAVIVKVRETRSLGEIKALLAEQIGRPEILEGKFVKFMPNGDSVNVSDSVKLGSRRSLIWEGAPLYPIPEEVLYSVEDFNEFDPDAKISTPRSLRACEIEGVLPEELIYAPTEAFLSQTANNVMVAHLRRDFFEAFRQDCLVSVRRAREMLIDGEEAAAFEAAGAEPGGEHGGSSASRGNLAAAGALMAGMHSSQEDPLEMIVSTGGNWAGALSPTEMPTVLHFFKEMRKFDDDGQKHPWNGDDASGRRHSEHRGLFADCFVGVKPFERALLAIYESNEVPTPSKTVHPLLLDVEDGNGSGVAMHTSWSELHPKLHPLGAGVPESRAPRKCWQLESCIAIAMLLSEDRAKSSKSSSSSSSSSWHLVDFAGGCGPLGLPLAAMLPWATVTIVELKKRSLDIARERANAAGLTNVRFFEGDIRAFDEPFDVGVALHACGDASDLVMEACASRGARFVVCPCCTGKLSSSRVNVFRYAITQSNDSRIEYPRSAAVRRCLDATSYDYLACAADVSDGFNLSGARGVLRRLCKAYLELDRSLWAAERGYTCFVTRMHRPEATPKADILYGWREGDAPKSADVTRLLTKPCPDEAYTEATRLGFGGGSNVEAAPASAAGTSASCGVCELTEPLHGSVGGRGGGAAGGSPADSATTSAQRLGGSLGASEWTEDELSEVFDKLRAVGAGEEIEVRAPSARRRRLVHYAAANLGLFHETTKKAVRVSRRPADTAPATEGGGAAPSAPSTAESEGVRLE